MATSSATHASHDEEFDDDDLAADGDEEEEDDDDDDDEHYQSKGGEEARLEAVLRRLTAEEVRIRVQEVAIRGCGRTRRTAVEATVGPELARAATMRELVSAAAAAGERLRRLEAFDTVAITLDAAPTGLPGYDGGTVIVLVDVAETRGRVAGELGVFANTQTGSCSVDGSVKLKNLLDTVRPGIHQVLLD